MGGGKSKLDYERVMREKERLESLIRDKDAMVRDLMKKLDEKSVEVWALKLALLEEKKKCNIRAEGILREKGAIEQSLVKSNSMIDEMKREIEEMVKEKSAQEREKSELVNTVIGLIELILGLKEEEELMQQNVADLQKKCAETVIGLIELILGLKEEEELMQQNVADLQKKFAETVIGLIELILGLKEEEELMQQNVADLQKKCAKGLEKERQMSIKINGLVREIEEMVKEKEVIGEEKSVLERKKSELLNTVIRMIDLIAGLKEEEELMQQNVADLQKKCAEGLEKEKQMEIKINGLADEKELMERVLEQLSGEKLEVEKAKNDAESEITLLKKQLSELKDTILSLEQTNSLSVERLFEGNSSLLKDLQGAMKNLEFEKQKLEQMSREKIEIEEAKNQAEYEIVELKKHLSEHKDSILSLKQSSGVALESLAEEKSSVMKDLLDTKTNLESQILKLEQISQEKIEIEKAKNQAESEIAELKKQLTECRNTIPSLEQSGLAQIDMIKTIESEIRNYKTAFDQTATEKDKAVEGVNEEKHNAMKLREKCLEMEKGIEEMQKLLEDTEAKGSKAKDEKNEVESQYAALKKTITSLEKTLAKAQKDYDDMKAKAEVADARSELVLSMIKNTAASISVPNGGEMAVRSRSFDIVQDKADGEDVKPYAEELDAIKKAFKGRESEVENMKRQLEFLQNSAAKARKGRNFWTLVSSAAIVAAASIAYATHAH